MKDWSALEEAAAALRRLNSAVAAFEVSDDDLRATGLAATELSERLEAGRPRNREQDIAALPTVAAPDLSTTGPDADRVEFDPFSLGGGRLNPASVGIDFRRESTTSVTARCTVDGMFQGPPGRVHGGVVALIVDELMSMINRLLGRRAFTVRLQVNLRAATPVGTELTFRAWEERVDGRKVVIRAEGRVGEQLIVEADALFVMVPG